jgi:hypothetical protein
MYSNSRYNELDFELKLPGEGKSELQYTKCKFSKTLIQQFGSFLILLQQNTIISTHNDHYSKYLLKTYSTDTSYYIIRKSNIISIYGVGDTSRSPDKDFFIGERKE